MCDVRKRKILPIGLAWATRKATLWQIDKRKVVGATDFGKEGGGFCFGL